jgi:hypothetical protein
MNQIWKQASLTPGYVNVGFWHSPSLQPDVRPGDLAPNS